jgi:predicted phosphodiesterase
MAAVRLLAISDLHLSHRVNREALPSITAQPDAWLAVAGDVGHQPGHLEEALDVLTPRFARVIWTPGNHDLWHVPASGPSTRGVERYEQLVAICRARGVITPEDPYPELPGHPGVVVAPIFQLFDYSFRPTDVRREDAVAWARASGVVSADERRLDPHPYPHVADWCRARCEVTAARLDALPAGTRPVLVSHWPLRYDLARPPRIPRFSIWCGTTRTEDWPRRYHAVAAISGHLHLRTTLWRDGIRCEEVSLGYPRDWRRARGIDFYVRQILPAPPDASRFVPFHDPFK